MSIDEWRMDSILDDLAPPAPTDGWFEEQYVPEDDIGAPSYTVTGTAEDPWTPPETTWDPTLFSFAHPALGALADEWGDLGYPTDNTTFGDLNWPNYQTDPDHPAFGGTPSGGGYYSQPVQPSAPGKPDLKWIIADDWGEEFANAPDWWRPFDISDSEGYSNPAVAATLMMNAVLGSGELSEEDARNMAKQMYVMWGSHEQDANPWDIYSSKFPADKGTDPESDPFGGPRLGETLDPRISKEQQLLGQTGPGVIDEGFFGQDRSRQLLDSLSLMREATVGGNVHEFGPGYQYLQEVAGSIGSAGDANTRAKRLQVLGELDPILAQGQGGDLGFFGPIAQAMASPFYTNLPPSVNKTQAGDYQFGSPSPYLMF